MTIVRFAAAALVALVLAPAGPQASELMTLEGKIPLGAVKGRIDHLAVDLGRNRLFVAELGNDSLGIVDLAKRTVAKRIGNLKEPQGVAYVRSADLIYVTNAGDGSVEIIKASNFSPAGERKLGDDADNIRVDPRSRQVFVGYGSGGLAVLDAASGRKTADIRLAAHPESFQLGTRGDRIFVNLPDARHIAVIARATGREIARWGLPDAAGNFAMALGEGGRRLLVAYRDPPTLAIFDAGNGAVLGRLPTCSDADDVFVDAKRNRVYVSCGAGNLAIIQRDGDAYREIARIKTSPGARTALFVPELDRLFLAVRAYGQEPTAIWILRPLS